MTFDCRPDAIFSCTQCGDCCRGYGGTFVTPHDIQTIAAHIGTDARRFVDDYCQLSGGRPVLAQAQNGYCVFWDRICTIHAVKPRMCRAWPFLESVLVDVGNWYVMAGFCPGMRIDCPDDDIRSAVIEMRRRLKLYRDTAVGVRCQRSAGSR